MQRHQLNGLEEKDRPRLIFWEFTTGCNLRCIHCRESAAELMSSDDLSFSECCRIIDQIAEYAPVTVVLGGGEPLWRRDVFDIAKQLRSKNMRVALASNGTLIDESMAHRIHAAGIERVAICLDGADAVAHDTFRGHQGAFDSAIRGLGFLKELGVSTQINTTVSLQNEHQLPEIIRLSEELGVNALHLFLLAPVGCGLTIPDGQALKEEDAERILAWLSDRSLDTNLEIEAICTPDSAPPYRELPAVTEGGVSRNTVCFISHQGEIHPCGRPPMSVA